MVTGVGEEERGSRSELQQETNGDGLHTNLWVLSHRGGALTEFAKVR
jgi:hypothetical protein